MKSTNSIGRGRISGRFIIIFIIFLTLSGLLNSLIANDHIKFNPDYKLKRISGTTVSVTIIDQDGQKQEYLITDFNADVLLLVYRKIDMEHITESLTKKYHLREDDCRRQVKIALNTFEEWEIILRT